ncbi:MAG TPA: hypothetical protein PLR08_03265 [bacterium]|nr:hypothetical protein [bacterium]
MDGKHFSLITIAMVILLGIVGLGFMQMNTNNTLSTISNRLVVVEQQIKQEPVKTEEGTAAEEATTSCKGDCDAGVVEYKDYQWDFSFKYPEDYSVGKSEDQNVIRIFSNGAPISGDHTLTIGKIENSDLDKLTTSTTVFTVTTNPLVQKIEHAVWEGDMTGAVYLVTTKRGKYLLIDHVTDHFQLDYYRQYPTEADLIERTSVEIINSIKE